MWDITPHHWVIGVRRFETTTLPRDVEHQPPCEPCPRRTKTSTTPLRKPTILLVMKDRSADRQQISSNKTFYLFSLKDGRSKGNGKAIPLQAWTSPEGSRKLRLPDLKTICTRSWFCQPYAPAAFTPQEIFLVLISVSAAGRIMSMKNSSDTNRNQNPRPTGLYRSASTNCATACLPKQGRSRNVKCTAVLHDSLGTVVALDIPAPPFATLKLELGQQTLTFHHRPSVKRRRRTTFPACSTHDEGHSACRCRG